MYEFIKSINLSEELKVKELYSLFKSNSSQFNSEFKASLKKFKSTKDFLNYSNGNAKITLEKLNNLFSIPFEIEKKEKEKVNNSEIDNYIASISKIIFLFLLIQKNVESLYNLLKSTKNYIQKFYKEGTIKQDVKEKIDSYLNELNGSFMISTQKNFSRRSTQEFSFDTNFEFLKSLTQNEPETNNLNVEEIIFPEIKTPKFKNDSEKENLKFTNIKGAINNEEPLNRLDSSLTLSKMKFAFKEDLELESKLQKTKSQDNYNMINKSKKKNNYENLQEFFKTKEFIHEILNEIYNLYKENQINSERKLELKQFIISNYKCISEKFYKIYDTNYNINENIKRFLKEYIKNNEKIL